MKTKKYILFLTIVLISLTVVMPFNVIKADDVQTGTYVDYVADECFPFQSYDTNRMQSYEFTSNGRIVLFKSSNYTTGNPYKSVYITLTPNTTYKYVTSSNMSLVCTFDGNGQALSSSSYNGNTFYYRNGALKEYQYQYYSDDFILIEDNNITSSNIHTYAYRYTYGDLAVAPEVEPVINYGLLKTGYSTKFVTTNFEGLNDRNIDTITWEDNDSNGNFIGTIGYDVEIRAIPGYYEASTQAALIAQNVQNFFRGLLVNVSGGSIDLEPVQYYTLVKTSASRKEFSITWEEVIDHFPQNWGRYYKQGSLLSNLQNEELWYKTGWLYEIRYLYNEGEEDEYISEWQTIYQVTAVDPGTSTNIIQNAPQGLTPEMYNLLQTVNTLNNTVQNWNINGVPINMEPQTAPTTDGSWIEYIINAISTMVGSIVDAIADIVKAILGIGSDIIEGLFNLINDLGVNLISFFRDLIESLTGADEQIDLTLPQWDPIAEDNGILDEFKALGNGFVNIFINSGLGYMLIIPLIIILLRLVF